MEPATLVVSRTSNRDLKFRGIEILLDGSFIADLQYEQSIDLPVSPGHHTLKATNRLKSKSVDFEAASGETIRFEVIGIALGGLWLVMTMLGTVVYKISLERVDERDSSE